MDARRTIIKRLVDGVNASRNRAKHKLRIIRYGSDDLLDPALVHVVGCCDTCQLHGLAVETACESGFFMDKGRYVLSKDTKDVDWFASHLKEMCRRKPPRSKRHIPDRAAKRKAREASAAKRRRW